jgi:hypothetical protein
LRPNLAGTQIFTPDGGSNRNPQGVHINTVVLARVARSLPVHHSESLARSLRREVGGGSAMQRNESTIDRSIRVLLGVAVLALTFVGPHTLWGLLGLIPLVTGVVGFCPLYRVLRISTCDRAGAPNLV